MDGRALLGEASAHLRRSQTDPDDVEALATIAALGSAGETELARLASTLGISTSKLARSITLAATAGLIDVSSRYSPDAARSQRVYDLRPPMLAAALVTERAFLATVPTLDLNALADNWSDHLLPLTQGAIDAARLGAAGARPVVDHLFERLLGSDPAPERLLETSKKFAALDERAGDRALLMCENTLRQLLASGRDDIDWANQGAVELAAVVAGRYHSQAAIKFLLDSAAVYRGRWPRPPAHPLRRLDDMITAFHPEFQRPVDWRDFIAIALANWWSEASSPGSVQQQVFADAAAALLSPRIRAWLTDPGEPRQLTIHEGVVSIEEMQHILDDTWPRIRHVLALGSDLVAATIINGVADWLRIGGGYDTPFGKEHRPESVAAAHVIALKLSKDIASIPQLSLGARLKLRGLLAWHNIDLDVEIPQSWEPFLDDDERGPDVDYAEREGRLTEQIAAAVAAWATEEPEVIVNRLVDLKRATTLAQLHWPNRVWIAAASLAQDVASPLSCLIGALDRELGVEATAFLPRVFNEALATPELVGRLLADRSTRPDVIKHCLLSESPVLQSMVFGDLEVDDFQIVETMYLRKQVSDDATRALLTQTTSRVCGMVAIAMFVGQGGRDHTGWSPGDLESQWLSAVHEFRSDEAAIPDHHEAALFAYLAVNYASDLTELIRVSLDESADDAIYSAFTHSSWNTLARLPPGERRKLLAHFKDRQVVMWMLRRYLIGFDISWLEELLDSGEMTADEVLAGYDGISGTPPLSPYARLLVPRGVAPERIAELRLLGGWTGPQSTRYAALVAEFEAMRQSDDPHVQAVAAAGQRMSAELRDAAVREEYQRRVRGEL